MASQTGVEGGIQLLKEEFGRELRRLRRAVNLTQDALARQAGYHRVSITQVEKGRQAFSRQFVTQVEAALNAQGRLLAIYERIDAGRCSRQLQTADQPRCSSTPVQRPTLITEGESPSFGFAGARARDAMSSDHSTEVINSGRRTAGSLKRPVVGSQQSRARSPGSARCLGVVSGYLLKLVREALCLTQSALAEMLALDIAMVQGWESGLKPLTTLPAAEFVRLRIRLIRLGAPPVIVDTLDEALSADMIVSEAVEVGSDLVGQDNHLLASFVHKRDLTNMITWPFTGVVPDRIRFLDSLRSNHCRHRVDAFGLDETEHARFFDYLLVTAEASTCSDTILPRRQAIYLLSFDARSESAEWLRSEQRRAWHCSRPGTDVPTWAAVRSSALALARFGDRDPVQAFVQHGLANEQQEVANLNYWAYWVGELPHIEPDDAFMVATDVSSWDGSTLLRHLLNRLEVGSEHADLNIHTLWTLLQARPSLLQIHTTLRSLARERIEQLMDDRELSAQTRQKLPALAYAIRLAER
ncbi:MAG: helix-turn-helix domain-containing protein [Egibacteraceae bacterium]